LASRLLDLTFRIRFWLHVLIYFVAFAITWADSRGAGAQRLWLTLPLAATANLRVSLRSAIIATSALAILFAFLGAFLRTWGGAHLGRSVVFDPQIQSRGFTSSGPFRYLRNPLYLGTILHTVALSVLMSWKGAAFAVVAVVILQVVLITSEERYLASKLGAEYSEYRRQVPRLIPRIAQGKGAVPSSADWPRAFAGEIYMWGTALSFAVFGSTYSALLILQGVMVSFGLSIVVRGLMPKAEAR